ncbi:nucleoside phosphorylase domain-containing protein [Yarrowia lipolytica]|jgi:purine-nucleoside phosphorylase|uniref:Purine nucleoside phosphorylase n=2 Tax=Yarrowia lipolytica TaxID=4952 RepID=Q6BZX6_YARLI|nr:YALI0F30129p [Yarrowia lipolytica CLIB122]AOW07894.1 hypothetical protein YALI1_F37714g [Yarrowia lipolytica]KAB8282283.1 nucleoside phosphorylase domain-containing protein [Yarrowia lipolytica]KAE8172331.1 nucleoside phosphorylase domain-containing protein [Yarrowia lipolytica]KAJ8055072.1 nucleoside phosphorylase domain-containing protein [Yarrowia lipolytica]QNP99514.1 Putative purine nucleoside phosphorylase [Yarrowia lipolytica]|eukprot:XP_506036.1 YALI0F30129p [Yarrowia lipolytica CLIB122]
MTDTFDLSLKSANKISDKLPKELQNPQIGIVCGSGLGGLANALKAEPQVTIEYKDIPGFKVSTVAGHAGKLVVGLLGEKNVPVVCMVGRFHFYEGYDIQDTVFPIRVFSQIGIKTVILTNAAGGLNQDFKVGDIMLINDHINLPGLAGNNPLRGPNDEKFGVRFLPLSDAYDHDLRRAVYDIAKKQGVTRGIHEGTYAFVSGPTYESRAEARMLSTIGADAVGMSTVPEVIVARHCGIKVLALSLITNVVVLKKPDSALNDNAAKLDEGIADHSEVMEEGQRAADDLVGIVTDLVNVV